MVSDPLVLLGAARALLRATCEEEIVGVVIEALRDLGVAVAPPTGNGASELPIDVTFGIGGPLVPVGDAGRLSVIAPLVTGLVEDARVAVERSRRDTHLAEAASLDSLTGLANRRITMRRLARLTEGDTVVAIDLDHFKQVNDNLGHGVGDSVLRAFARSLRRALRAADTAGRTGGEEFVVLLERCDASGARSTVERLGRVWCSLRPVDVTFSAGIAEVTETGGPDALDRADAALYTAKDGGRDRTVVAPTTTRSPRPSTSFGATA